MYMHILTSLERFLQSLVIFPTLGTSTVILLEPQKYELKSARKYFTIGI